MKALSLKKFLDRVGFRYNLKTLAEGRAVLVSKDGKHRTAVYKSAKYLMSRVEQM